MAARVITVDFGVPQSGVGYLLRNAAGANVGIRVTAGIVHIVAGLYRATADDTGAVAVYWDCAAAGVDAVEPFEAPAAGIGACTVTARVTDGTVPLQNASVRVRQGIADQILKTDADGECVFALDIAAYQVAVTKDGYQFAPTTRTVTGEEAGTLTADLVMTAMVIVPPADPAQTTAILDVYDREMALAANVQFTFRLDSPPSGLTGQSHNSMYEVSSDANGRISVPLLRSARYSARRSGGEWVAFTTGTGGSYLIPVVLGRP